MRARALRVIPAETRLTVYRRRPFLSSKIGFRIDFSSVLEVLEASKIGLRCAASDGISEIVRKIEK